MPKNILFISNTEVTNPILHSQGLPLLEHVSMAGYETHFVSFNYEKNNLDSDLTTKIKNKYGPNILFREITLTSFKYLPAWITLLYFGSKEIVKLLKAEEIQIIHARSLFPAIIGLIAKKKSNVKIKLIYDNRGLYIKEGIFIGRWKRNSLKVFSLRFLERLVINNSSAIVIVSNKFKEFIVENYSNKIAKKLYVINNKVKIIPNIKRPNSDNVFVYAGSSAKWYCIEDMFILFVEIRKVIYDPKFVILTYEVEDFSAMIKSYPSLQNVTKILNIFSDDVHCYLEKCNVGVMLREQSVFTRVSAPLKFAEYLNAGLPILVNEGVGDTEDIINKYNVGTVIKGKDYSSAVKNLKLLLQDTEVRNRCKMVAKLEFDQQDAFKQYLNIYSALINDE